MKKDKQGEKEPKDMRSSCVLSDSTITLDGFGPRRDPSGTAAPGRHRDGGPEAVGPAGRRKQRWESKDLEEERRPGEKQVPG